MTAALWFAAGFTTCLAGSALFSLLLLHAATRTADPEPDLSAMDTGDEFVVVDPADPTPVHTALCIAELRRELRHAESEGIPWS